jgi:hypothetical protein
MAERLVINFGREPQCDGCSLKLDKLEDELKHSGISCAGVETTTTYGEVVSHPPLIPDGNDSFKCLGNPSKEVVSKQTLVTPVRERIRTRLVDMFTLHPT